MPDYPSPLPLHARLDIYRCFAFAISTVGPSNNVHYHSTTSTQPNQTKTYSLFCYSTSIRYVHLFWTLSLRFVQAMASRLACPPCDMFVKLPSFCTLTYNCFTVSSVAFTALSLLHHCHGSLLVLNTDTSVFSHSAKYRHKVLIRFVPLLLIPHLAFLYRKTSQWLPTDAALGRSMRTSGLSTS